MTGQHQNIDAEMPNKLGKDRNRTCPFEGNCTFMFWNAGGFTQEKQIEFDHLIHVKEIDAFAICEAGSISDYDRIQDLEMQGYVIYHLPRKRQIAAGMIIGVKKELTARYQIIYTMEEKDKLELVQLEVWKGHAKTKYIIAYNPPNNVTQKLDTVDIDRNTILVGDFNAHNVNWGYSDTCKFGDILENYVDSQPLILLEGVSSPYTFLSTTGRLSRPDLAFCHVKLYEQLKQENLSSPSGADHKMLLITRANIGKQQHENKISWNFKKANWKEYQRVTKERFERRRKTNDVNAEYKEFCKIILDAAGKCIPRGSVKKYKPFWSKKLQELVEKRNKARKNAERMQTQESFEILKKSTADFREELKKSKRETLHKYVSNIDYRKDGTKAHTFFSKLCSKDAKQYDNKPIIYKNKQLIGNRAKADALCKHMAKQSNSKNLGHIKVQKYTFEDKVSDIYNGVFVITEINEAIKKLRNKKSPGVDGIHPEFLKQLEINGRRNLQHLCNIAWKGDIPDGWRKADIIPILKKGKDASKVESYRPISLTSMIAKVMEHMVNLRLKSYLEAEKCLTMHQAGFRSHCSTVDQIAYIMQEAKEGFNKRHSTLAVYIDFKTAFDVVDRRRLLQKIKNMEVPNNLTRWVKTFLSQRFIRVKYKDKFSAYRQTKSGVPQGAVLSPTLFLIYINDLESYIKERSDVKIKLYADDVMMWCTNGDEEYMEKEMNRALQALNDWAKRDGMTVNEAKTVFDHYTMAHNKTNFNLQFDGKNLCQEENAVYLGMTLDTKMTGKAQIEKICKAGKKRLNFMKRVAGVDWGASTEVLATTYKTYVRPVLEYGNAVLVSAPHNYIQMLDRVQNQALRIATGAVKSTPITAIEMHTNTPPLSARRNQAAICLHERLIRKQQDYWDREPVERLKTQTTFISKVKQLKNQIMKNVNLEERLQLPEPDMRVAVLEVQHELEVEGMERTKSYYTEDQLRSLTVEYLNKRYPTDEWLHVYTDGSATPGEGNAGAGVYSKLFQQAYPAGKNGSAYDGEIKAIKEALTTTKEMQIPKTVILSDSKAAIQAITCKREKDLEILECKRMLVWLHNRNKIVVLQWIPAHCNVQGNNAADSLARKGSKMKQFKKSLSFGSVKAHVSTTIKECVKRSWKEESKGNRWSQVFLRKKKWRNRQTETAQFRMETGHDLLAKHLCKLGLLDRDECALCGMEEHSREHLQRCQELQDIRDKLPTDMADAERESYLYWETRKRMMTK